MATASVNTGLKTKGELTGQFEKQVTVPTGYNDAKALYFARDLAQQIVQSGFVTGANQRVTIAVSDNSFAVTVANS